MPQVNLNRMTRRRRRAPSNILDTEERPCFSFFMKIKMRGSFPAAAALAALAFTLITVTATAGDLYYTDSRSKIFRINSNGVRHLVAHLRTPSGLAFDSSGDLFVADYEGSNIYRFDANRDRTLFASNRLISNPSALIFDSAGNLWVAHNGSDPGITKIAPDGTKTQFARHIEPSGLAFDADGNLYADDFLRNVVFKYTPDGTRSIFAHGFGQPVDLAFDADGNLYVSDLGNLAIYKITPDGSKSTFAEGLSQPIGLTFDSDGNLYVADYPDILEIDPDGNQTIVLSQGAPNYLKFRP